jgi:hypothetical protein
VIVGDPVLQTELTRIDPDRCRYFGWIEVYDAALALHDLHCENVVWTLTVCTGYTTCRTFPNYNTRLALTAMSQSVSN